jgi:hypothetical protein
MIPPNLMQDITLAPFYFMILLAKIGAVFTLFMVIFCLYQDRHTTRKEKHRYRFPDGIDELV